MTEHDPAQPGEDAARPGDTPPRPAAAAGRLWLRRLIPVLLLALGIGGAVLLASSREPPRRRAPSTRAMAVEVMPVRQEQRSIRVTSNGVIQPRVEASIAAEVSGKVLWVNPSLVVGGLLREGDVMLRIDPADYRLAVDKARFAVAQADKNLALERSSARVARSEWQRLGRATRARGTPNALVLREPQLKAARAALASARADLQMAQLNLRRATVRAPFNLRVRAKQVDRGQYVRTGQTLVTVYGTDVAEVVVPLPVAELRWLEIPRAVGKRAARVKGTPATVRLKTGKKVHERQGRLVRSVGEVDRTGRMSRVVVAIDDPYSLRADAKDRRVEFEIGAFVEVALAGRTLERVVPIPAYAIRAGGKVWVVGADDTLEIREVTTARVTADEALVVRGLKAGDRVVLSNITNAVQGMRIEPRPTSDPRVRPREARRP